MDAEDAVRESMHLLGVAALNEKYHVVSSCAFWVDQLRHHSCINSKLPLLQCTSFSLFLHTFCHVR